jgi:NADH-quinone oxidoreductase subunit G
MSDTVTLKINGQDVTVPKGTTVIEAARTIGIEIPHFCYHPALETVGSCRMCQVEFVAGDRKFLGISCRTDVAEGMEVLTHSESAVRARAGALEFQLTNHPLDCPICDKAGECSLQDYAYEHGFAESRFKEQRRTVAKKIPLGGHIIYDAERCILCTRCVRFMADIARAPQLTVAGRGDGSRIDTFPGRKLDSEYSGNVSDLCPVGALTIAEFRFKCRVWNLKSTPSICPYCSRGCNIDIAVRKGRRSILRVMPRPNQDVHGHFICNTGRFAPLALEEENRFTTPLVDGKAVHLDRALEAAAEGLRAHKGRLLVITSTQHSTEELFVTKTVFEPLAGDRIVAVQPERDKGDGILRTGDPAANADGCDVLDIPLVSIDELGDLLSNGEIDAVFLSDPAITLPEEMARGVAFLAFLGHRDNGMPALAGAAIPGLPWTEKEGTFINFQGRIQKFLPAAPPPAPGMVPDLVSLTRLGRLLSVEGTGRSKLPADPAGVFNVMADGNDDFSGLTYSDVGATGVMLPDEENGDDSGFTPEENGKGGES